MTDDEIRSRRERIATAAMQGVIGGRFEPQADEAVAIMAVQMADALIAALDAEPGEFGAAVAALYAEPAAQSMRRALELAADAVQEQAQRAFERECDLERAGERCMCAARLKHAASDLRERAAKEPTE